VYLLVLQQQAGEQVLRKAGLALTGLQVGLVVVQVMLVVVLLQAGQVPVGKGMLAGE
jgi:hypothetical protein